MSSDASQTMPLGDDAELIAIAREYEVRCQASSDPPASFAEWLGRVAPGQRAVLLRRLVAVAANRLTEQGVENAIEGLVAANPTLESELRGLLESRDAPTTGHDGPDDGGSSGGLLRVRCPHCRNPIEVIADSDLDSVACPSCGSDFCLARDTPTRVTEPTRSVAHFDLIERVGAGAFGEVWKAHDTKLDRTVAVKVPRRGVFDRVQEKLFLREAQSAAQLSHPRIVPVHEVGRDEDTLYIVSDFVRGMTLAEWMTGQTATTREAAEYARQIAEALEHAHERGVVHRDLKPGNVMLDGLDAGKGECRLMDFGLARRDAGTITMTRDGQVLGTPAYMSPEQARGDAHAADRRSDVYSLGVILFELLTGERPFRGAERMLLHQVIHDEPPSPRKLNATVPRDLETITLKCLDKDPDRRYAAAGEVEDELELWLAGRPIAARPISATLRATRWCRRNPWPAATGAVIGLGLLLTALGGLAFARHQAVQRERESVARQAAETARRESDQLRELADSLRAEAEEQKKAAIEQSKIRAEALRAASQANDDAKRSLRQAVASRDKLKRSTELLVALFDPTSTTRFGGRDAVAKVLRQSEALFDNNMDVERLAKASLLAALGSSLRIDGYADDAVVPLEEALEIRTDILGKDSDLVQATQREIRLTLDRTRESPTAVSALERQVKRLREQGGTKPVDTILAMQRLANEYSMQNRTSDQLATLEEACRLADAEGIDQTHPARAAAINNLADCLIDVGELERAIPLLREAVKIMRGDDRWDLESRLASVMNLGRAYRETGRFAESIEQYEAVAKESRELLGEEHSFTIKVVNALSITLSRSGRIADAIDLLNQVIEARERMLGSSHRLTLQARSNLGIAQIRAEEYDQAAQILKEVLRLRTESFGALDADTLSTIRSLAAAYAYRGDYDAAIAACDRALQGHRQSLGPTHPETLDVMHSLVNVYMMAGKLQKARSLATELVELASKALSANNAKLSEYRGSLKMTAEDERLLQARSASAAIDDATNTEEAIEAGPAAGD